MARPIDATHPAYDTHCGQWQRCRDAVAGSDAVKARGTQYLPALSAQRWDEYDAYRMRALWFGAAGRTLQGLTGAIMRKAPVVTVPTALHAHLTDVTLTGISFAAFAKTVLEEVLTTGRYGVLVDLPAEEHDPQRPYYAGYTAESILNWSTRVVRGLPVLDLVVLREEVRKPKPDDRFAFDTLTQYRLLTLNDSGLYQVELFHEDLKQPGDVLRQSVMIPSHRGQPFPYIPFCFFGPTTITPGIEKPPIVDLVDVNLSHYRSSADLEHGRHFCGLPTPWVAGFPSTTQLKIGSAIAWVATDPQAKAGMLEFTGQGLGALEKALESKERLMAVLGARLLEEQKHTVEAADTLATRLSGEHSVLRSVAGSVSTGLSKLLEWTALWSGVAPEEATTATAKLNTDFLDASMTFAELTHLIGAWQAGAISYETMYYNMERGEVTRPGIDWETEKTQIDTDGLSHPPDPERRPIDFGPRG